MPTNDRLYKRGKIYWADLRPLGGERVSTGCTTRGAALAVLTRLETEATGGGAGRQDEPPTVKDALDHLSETTLSRSTHYLYRIAPLVRLLGQVQLRDLDATRIAGYVTGRRAEAGKQIPAANPQHKPRTVRVSDHTISKELKALGTALRQARVRKLYAGPDVGDLIPPGFSANYQPRERWLTEEEWLKLRRELTPGRRLWLSVAVFTGARSGEVNAMRWDHFDWALRRLTLQGTKTARSRRTSPIPEALAGILEPHRWEGRGRADTDEGFGPYRTERTTGEIAPHWAWANDCRDLEAACKRAAIPRCTPNDLRRTFASWMAQGNVSPLAIARLLGQTTTQMVDRVYARLSPESLAESVKVLPTDVPTNETRH